MLFVLYHKLCRSFEAYKYGNRNIRAEAHVHDTRHFQELTAVSWEHAELLNDFGSQPHAFISIIQTTSGNDNHRNNRQANALVDNTLRSQELTAVS